MCRKTRRMTLQVTRPLIVSAPTRPRRTRKSRAAAPFGMTSSEAPASTPRTPKERQLFRPSHRRWRNPRLQALRLLIISTPTPWTPKEQQVLLPFHRRRRNPRLQALRLLILSALHLVSPFA